MVDHVPGTQHELIKAEKFASTSVALLQRELILPSLFWRWSAMDFKGAKDDTINVKVPGTLNARDRALRATGEDRRIQMDFLKERTMGVRLDKFPYSATAITDEQMDLDVENFASQILKPQVDAVARYVNKLAVDHLNSVVYADGRLSDDRETFEDKTKIKGNLKAEDFYGPGKRGMASLFNRVRSTLIKRGVNQAQVYVAIGADFEEVLLDEMELLFADKAGDNTALRDATIGKLRGFNFVSVPEVKGNEAHVFTPQSFVLATAAPSIPAGAVTGATQNANGVALRWLRDYNADYAEDRSIVDCYAGTGTINDIAMADGTEAFIRGVKITMDVDKVMAGRAAAEGTAPASAPAGGA